jgi:putative hydrolase of the HAD superfamily
MRFRAVIFDLGGVVFPSPFDAFDAYERDAGLPARFVRQVIAASAEDGAWARFERSEPSCRASPSASRPAPR